MLKLVLFCAYNVINYGVKYIILESFVSRLMQQNISILAELADAILV